MSGALSMKHKNKGQTGKGSQQIKAFAGKDRIKMIIKTERLILRLWKESDAADLFAYAVNENVGPPAGWKPHENISESLSIIRELFIPNKAWAITDRENGKVIGSIGLENDKRRPGLASKELGYSLAEDYWGRGIATEAAKAVIQFGFRVMQLDMISVCTGNANKRSQRIIEKCGFVYEGVCRRCYKIYDGTVRDSRCYSLFREEWEIQNGSDSDASDQALLQIKPNPRHQEIK